MKSEELKFRAWDKKAQKMSQSFSLDDALDRHDTWADFGQNWDTGYIEQFTGLLDKNGKEVFEGDIVDGGGHGPVVVRIGKYDNNEDSENHESGVGVHYVTKDGRVFGPWLFGKSPVIGNIHENPDLLP